MQHCITVYEDTGLADDELKRADERTRAFYRRVYALMNMSGCNVRLAIEAVEAADEEIQD